MFLFGMIVAAGGALSYLPYVLHGSLTGTIVILCGAFLVASLVSSAIKVASPWDRAVVLRLGRFRKLCGPGLFGSITVVSVEVRDVLIPSALEDAMSMQAQAERERQARVILGDSEQQVAEKFGEAAKTYAHDPIALHLRAMNMLYEGLKRNSTIVIVPSTAIESMQLGGLTGVTALTMGLGRDGKDKDAVVAGAA